MWLVTESKRNEAIAGSTSHGTCCAAPGAASVARAAASCLVPVGPEVVCLKCLATPAGEHLVPAI